MVKLPGLKDKCPPPTSAEDKNAWSYMSTPPIRLHGVVISLSTGKTLETGYGTKGALLPEVI